ncbi:peptidylprolyl isomerase [candidate division GN15 bacterium]|jgi:FKBP-type peptidyl-prolyl cis-trans isomerase 2|nr:peptidylprolyl isomerase [candidate division GN15 bacterium]
MAEAKSGDTVKVHYTGKLNDGTVFDSSREREPLEVTIGAGQVIPGFENGIIGMAPGETKSISVSKDEAYGDHRQELTMDVNKSDFPETITPEVGQMLQMKNPNGDLIRVVVSEIKDDTVTIDANHPLAGKDLTFELELVAID